MTCPACASGGYKKMYNSISQEFKIEMQCPVCTALVESPGAAAAGIKTLVTRVCDSAANIAINSAIAAGTPEIAKAVHGVINALDSVCKTLGVSVSIPNLSEGDIVGNITSAAKSAAQGEVGKILG